MSARDGAVRIADKRGNLISEPRIAAGTVTASQDCRWCGHPSTEGHPAGVLLNKWRCTSCRGWQDDEFAPDQLEEL